MIDRETLLEAAALAALDLVPPAERRGLDAGLRESPELAAEARQLADAAALLAFAAPPQPVPAAVWPRIAACLPPGAPTARVIPFPRRLRSLVTNGWAVAACLAFGWAVQFWWPKPASHLQSEARLSPAVRPPASEKPPAAQPGLPDAAAPAETSAAHPLAPPPAVNRDTVALLESRRLQAEVRLLSSRVGELTRQLEESAILPPATTPLHVFQLRLTNFAGHGAMVMLRPQDGATADPAAAAAGLTEALALASARTLSGPGDALPAGSIADTLFASDAPVSVIGFVSPATGQGAIVVNLHPDAGIPAGSTLNLSQAGATGEPTDLLASGTTSDSTTVLSFSTVDGVPLTGSGAGGFVLTIQPPANAPPPGETPTP